MTSHWSWRDVVDVVPSVPFAKSLVSIVGGVLGGRSGWFFLAVFPGVTLEISRCYTPGASNIAFNWKMDAGLFRRCMDPIQNGDIPASYVIVYPRVQP